MRRLLESFLDDGRFDVLATPCKGMIKWPRSIAFIIRAILVVAAAPHPHVPRVQRCGEWITMGDYALWDDSSSAFGGDNVLCAGAINLELPVVSTPLARTANLNAFETDFLGESTPQALASNSTSFANHVPNLETPKIDKMIRHSSGITSFPLCSHFAYPPDGIMLDDILADILPRFEDNVLAYESFGTTRSVKWRFPFGGMQDVMEPSTFSWAKPLVDAFADPEADLFILNGLAVPCGADVAGHYDDTIFSRRTGIKVSVLFLDLPPGNWSGGVLKAWSSMAGALRDEEPSCSASPVIGTSVHFRGDMFHGISPLHCDELGGERISVVLEQYSMMRFPLAVILEINDRPIELKFSEGDSTSELRRKASEFVVANELTGGAGCNHIECMVDIIYGHMNEQLEARALAKVRLNIVENVTNYTKTVNRESMAL